MKKRGQLTLFIISGVVFLLVLGILFFIAKSLYEKRIEPAPKAILNFQEASTALEKQFEICFEDTLERGVQLFGLQGGHTEVDRTSPLVPVLSIKNLYFEGEDKSGSLDEWSSALEKFIENEIVFCDSLLDGQNTVQWEFSGKPNVTISFSDAVRADLKYKLVIKGIGNESNAKTREDFSAEIPVRLKFIHITVKDIVRELRKKPRWLPDSFFSSIPAEVTVTKYSDNKVLINIVDHLSKVNGQSYVFNFGVVYGNESAIPNNPPKIINQGDVLMAYEGQQFNYTLKATDPDGDLVSYGILKAPGLDVIADIDALTGAITFTPAAEDIGIYNIGFAAYDDSNDFDVKYFTLKVMP